MTNPTARQPGDSKVQWAVFLGLLANIALALIKLAAGVLGASAALIADAVESITDILGSVVIWGGLHMASRPPDENHPYGHGKIEALAALAVTALIAAAGFGIAVQSIRLLYLGAPTTPAPFTVVVLLFVVVVKEFLARFMGAAARRERSSAAFVESWHHRSDALTSLAAAVGISASLLGGPPWASADKWAALFTAGVILFNAGMLARLPLLELTDAQESDITPAAVASALRVPGVRRVETPRRYGRHLHIDMHIEVDPDMPVREAHRIAHEAQDAVRADLPRVRRVLVHIEPLGGVHAAPEGH